MDYTFLAPDLPDLKNEWWYGLARHIKETMGAWHDARQELAKRWHECDMIYMCRKRLPKIENMQYLSSSDFGDADVHDAVNNFCIRLSLGLMDDKEDWLTFVGNAGETPEVLRQVKFEQAWMHRLAGTRRVYGRGIKQMVIRGSTDWWLQWKNKEVWRTVGTRRGRKLLAQHIVNTAGFEKDAAAEYVKGINRIRKKDVSFNGPVPTVLDSYDVFRNPEQSILQDERPGFIVRTYVRPHELENAIDPKTRKSVYENLEGLRASTAGDVYYEDRNGGDANRRMRSERVLGLNPLQNNTYSAEVVPVYVYYEPYLYYDGYEFFDCYFYMAINDNGEGRIIRIEENPSDTGHHLLVSDNFIDYFTNVAYGIGAVHTIANKYHQKNFLSELLLIAAAAAQGPSYMYASGMFKDDMVDFSPWALNEIMASMSNLDVIKPIPQNPAAIQVGFQDMNYWKQQIQSTFEVSGAFGSDAGLSPSSRATATEINFRESSQSLAVQEQIEKFGPSLQKICQWAYDESQEAKRPATNEYGEAVVPYAEPSQDGGSYAAREISFGEWKRPRRCEIVGRKGLLNKSQRAMNLQEGMKGFGQLGQFLPNPQVCAQAMMREYFKVMDIEMPPEAFLTPQELAAQDPAVQQMVMQDPQVQIMAVAAGMDDPQIMQEAAQMGAQMKMQQMEQSANGNGQGNAQPPPRNGTGGA